MPRCNPRCPKASNQAASLTRQVPLVSFACSNWGAASMASISKSNGTFSVRAHVGDAKTLLAFNIDKAEAQDLAGFSIFCKQKRHEGFYLQNTLQFERPADHAQDTSLPPNSSINAPLHKFRWLHVPGSVHHAENPFYGPYGHGQCPAVCQGQVAAGLHARVYAIPGVCPQFQQECAAHTEGSRPRLRHLRGSRRQHSW